MNYKLLFFVTILVTHVCAMEKEITQHEIWSILPADIELIILSKIANDDDVLLALKTIKNLEQINHHLNDLCADKTILPVLFFNLKNNAPSIINCFIKAAACNNIKGIKGCLEHFQEFINIDVQDRPDRNTALITAVKADNTELVKYLLDEGADVLFFNSTGQTALLYACLNQNKDIIKLLLLSGALYMRHDITTHQLFHAVVSGEIDRVKKFISASHSDAQDNDHRSPLMFAVVAGDKEMVELLVQHGANVQAKDYWGETALTMAIKNNIEELARILQNSLN